MIELSAALGVLVIALGMVLTPGPNMIYLASRAISQGRRAGLVSLGGTAVGFLCYLVAATAGLSALFVAVPAAYTTVKIAGALYLAWLAWSMLRPGGRSPFEPRPLEPESDARLFGMGLLTNLLNPKIALMYAALLPQFVNPADGALATPPRCRASSSSSAASRSGSPCSSTASSSSRRRPSPASWPPGRGS